MHLLFVMFKIRDLAILDYFQILSTKINLCYQLNLKQQVKEL